MSQFDCTWIPFDSTDYLLGDGLVPRCNRIDSDSAVGRREINSQSGSLLLLFVDAGLGANESITKGAFVDFATAAGIGQLGHGTGVLLFVVVVVVAAAAVGGIAVRTAARTVEIVAVERIGARANHRVAARLLLLLAQCRWWMDGRVDSGLVGWNYPVSRAGGRIVAVWIVHRLDAGQTCALVSVSDGGAAAAAVRRWRVLLLNGRLDSGAGQVQDGRRHHGIAVVLLGRKRAPDVDHRTGRIGGSVADVAHDVRYRLETGNHFVNQFAVGHNTRYDGASTVHFTIVIGAHDPRVLRVLRVVDDVAQIPPRQVLRFFLDHKRVNVRLADRRIVRLVISEIFAARRPVGCSRRMRAAHSAPTAIEKGRQCH